jgi:predicted HAD superfamily Cof-like phosphohydrolase
MTHTPMKNVAEFHDKFHRDGKGRHERPISVSIFNARLRLIIEEFEEVVEAMQGCVTLLQDKQTDTITYAIMDRATKAHLAKELADLLYVVYGTAEELLLPLEEVFNTVHESNMSKIWDDGEVHYNDFGKIIKPPTYSPPDIESILNA